MYCILAGFVLYFDGVNSVKSKHPSGKKWKMLGSRNTRILLSKVQTKSYMELLFCFVNASMQVALYYCCWSRCSKLLYKLLKSSNIRAAI